MKVTSVPHLMASIHVTSSFYKKRVGAVHWKRKAYVESTFTIHLVYRNQ